MYLIPKHAYIFVTLLCLLVVSVHAQKNLINSGDILKEGAKLLEDQKYKAAVDMYRQIPRSDTNYVNALNDLSVAFDADSNFTESLHYAQLGLKLFPEKANDWYSLIAKSYLESSKYNDAITYYDKIIKNNANAYVAYYNKGITYYRQEQFADAKKCFQQTVLINPYYSAAHYFLGVIAFNEGNMVPAMLSFTCNLLMGPENKYHTRSVQALNAIADVTDEVTKNVNGRKASSTDNFDMLQEIILSKIALDKQYKLKVALDDKIVRQLQVTFEKISFDPKDKGFWMQYYVPYFEKIYKQEQLEPLVYYMFSGLDIKDVQSYVKKNKKGIDKFTGIATTYFEDIKQTHELEVQKRAEVKARFLYSGYNVIGKGEWKFDGKETQLLGPWEFYYNNGMLKSKGLFDETYKKTGEWVFYYDNGQIKERSVAVNGKLNGKSRNWYDNGLTMEEAEYKDDKQIATHNRYFYNGLPKATEQYSGGKKEGKASGYTSNGVLEYTASYKDDKEDGEITYYHPNRKVASQVEYKLGEPDGVFKRYYLDGTLKLEGSFVNGKRSGTWKEYYNDSQQKNEAIYVNGEMDGTFIEYHENGKMMTRSTYVKGKLEGKYEDFSKEGKLYSESVFEKDKIKELKFYDKSGKMYSSTNSRTAEGKLVFYNAEGNKMSEGIFTKEGSRNGKSIFYYRNGKISIEANYKEGNLQGERVTYYKNGKVHEKVNYTEDEEDGYKQVFFEDGTLSGEGMMANGKKQGLHIDYNELGNVIAKSNYLDGDIHGYMEYYLPNGKMNLEERYDHGWLIHSTHFDSTGNIAGDNDLSKGSSEINYKNNNGKIYASTAYKGYNLNGDYRLLFPDGSTELVQYYKYGIADSIVKKYYRNGKLHYEGRYNMGEKDGKWIFYYDSGKPYYTQVYNNGRLNGSYTTYNEDGSVNKEMTYKENELDGAYKIFGENNQLAVILNFDEGNLASYSYEGKDGQPVPAIDVVNGTAHITGFYKNGVKSIEEIYDNNELSGPATIYFFTGKVYVEGQFLSGYNHGIKKVYYANNQLQKLENYFYENYNGESKSYFENGKLKSEENYYNGKRHGVQKYYDSTGKLINTLTYYYDVLETVR